MLHLRLRPLLAFLTVAAALTFVAVDFADARAGRGGSFGSRGMRTYSSPPPTATAPGQARPVERTMTQPGQPSAAARPAQTQPGGLFNRPGLAGGLIAGLLGAGLIGLLLGNGLLGGLGSLASFLGLALQIGLIVIVARLLWKWWQRRSQPALAGMPRSMSDESAGSAPLPPTAMSPASVPHQYGYGAGATAPSDDIGITSADYDTFERLLSEIQTAYSREDVGQLRRLATPEMVSYFNEELAESASRGEVNEITNVKLEQGDVSETWREGDVEYATVAMRFSMIDKTVERATGRIVRGSAEPTEATELWTFMRARGGDWLLAALQQG